MGKGVPENHIEAIKWYRKAAEQAYVPAQYRLGYCYKYGRGVEIDIFQAYNWFQLASDHGNMAPNVEAKWKLEALTLTALMSPSELKTAKALYIEFKNSHPAGNLQ